MNRSDLQELSRIRKREAMILLSAGRFEGAYYLMGYAVECALKACIAKQFDRYDFPDKTLVDESYTHNLEKLLKLSGLRAEFDKESSRDVKLRDNWLTVKDWSEKIRYSKTVSRKQAQDFYKACVARGSGILSWLRSRW